MRVTEAVERKIVEQQEVSCTCDICHVEIERQPEPPEDSLQRVYYQLDAKFERAAHDKFPGGDSVYTSLALDICTKCFVERLVKPALAAGTKLRYTDDGSQYDLTEAAFGDLFDE